MNGLEEARMVRKRKDRAADCLHEILEQTRRLRWAIFPDGEKVYLDLNEVQNLEEVRGLLANLLRRHYDAEKELCRQTAKPAT